MFNQYYTNIEKKSTIMKKYETVKNNNSMCFLY